VDSSGRRWRAKRSVEMRGRTQANLKFKFFFLHRLPLVVLVPSADGGRGGFECECRRWDDHNSASFFHPLTPVNTFRWSPRFLFLFASTLHSEFYVFWYLFLLASGWVRGKRRIESQAAPFFFCWANRHYMEINKHWMWGEQAEAW
jgi:hypothetical protein